MKSNKQRRHEIKTKRQQKKNTLEVPLHAPAVLRAAPCNTEKLKPYTSYGDPDFVRRGYYLDRPFRCVDCDKEEVWRVTQQKWWYETAQGNVETQAKRCRACRRRERERKAQARKTHQAGLAAREVKGADNQTQSSHQHNHD